MPDFFQIEYLQHGNERQRAAYRTLNEYAVFETLAAFDAVLAGTIPIGIDVPGSDLDIICYWSDPALFGETLRHHFSTFPGFALEETGTGGEPTVIARFDLGPFEVEVFGQAIPVRQQNAYRHMMIEHRILEEKGEEFRQQVIALKRQGMKTEPAFALLLGLDTRDPYRALLELE